VEVATLIQQPESKTLEFKRDLSSTESILKTIVAFANTAGGTLIIGCTAEGSIIGIQDPLAAETKLANVVADGIRPFVLPEIEVVTVEGKHLLVVQVAHSGGPCYLKSQGMPAGVYVRLGSTSRPASPELLAEMQRSLAYTSFDQEPVPELSTRDLDLDCIRHVFEKVERSPDDEKLQSLGVLTKHGNRVVPTFGGLILFGKEAQRMRFVPDARVSCARFRGTDKTHFLDRYEIEGTILDALDEGLKFIERNTRLAAEISRLYRRDIPEYPSRAVREAFINALVHADYAGVGSHLHVAIFSDRLEISNPGMLPFGYTLEDLKRGISRVRNRVIVRVFRELNLMEEWGSGYRRIVSDCTENGYPLPRWTESSLLMCITFYPHPDTLLPAAGSVAELSDRQKTIRDLLQAHGPLSSKEIGARLRVSVPTRTLRQDLARLRTMGLVKSIGKGPSTRWAVR
jgi:ATP-dependent DNA helicase RecG